MKHLNGAQSVSDCIRSQPSQPTSKSRSAVASFTAAVVVCGLLHPFDLIKTRLQVSASAAGAIPTYYGTRDAAWSIYRSEGVRGLYKGLTATVIASGVSWGLFRFTFDSIRFALRDLRQQPPSDRSTAISFNQNLVASSLAGLAATLMVHPLWLVKSRIEMQSVESKAARWMQCRGRFDCLRSIVQHEGPRALYKGLVPGLCLVPHAALQLLLYEELKKHTSPDGSTGVPPWMPFMWGGASKLVASACTYPLQVFRSRQQMQRSPFAGKSMAFLARELVRCEGVLGLYRGFFVNIQRTCLNSGLMFLLFETLTGQVSTQRAH
eukprot:GDKI01012651.1.p1 GENE.GDKI01012651.1~~GDKI01012651.1.p1  ORF type:complete len:322 (-),score=34.82 GDKI01012651.1:107-1072(-)